MKYRTCLGTWNLQPTLTDPVNIGPDPPKMLSYRPVGSSGNSALHCSVGRNNYNLNFDTWASL